MRRKQIMVGVAVLLVFTVSAIIYLSGRKALMTFLYPSAPPMPPVVQATASELLVQLEGELRTKFPVIFAALQPGLSDSEITALETQGGVKLNEDLRALYRWHNGMGTNTSLTFFTGHYFPPLEYVIGDLNVTKNSTPLSGAQSAAVNLFAGHTQGWLDIFPDGAGDGFVYDTRRKDSEGAFFYHFTEVSDFVYFPAVRNFLAATVESIKTGGYFPAKDGKSMEEDYDKVALIWKKYGSSPNRDRE